MIDKLLLKFLLAGSAALLPLTGGASVIYNWVPVDHSKQLVTLFGKIEVSDAAWWAGGFSYSTPSETFGINASTIADPESPLISFDFRVAPAKLDGSPMFPCDHQSACMIYGAPRTGEGGPYGFFGYFDFIFDASGLLGGSMSANNGESHVIMASGPTGLWSVNGFGSDDAQMGCYWEYCTGGTGFWQLDPTSIPVPAPSQLPLLAAATLALIGTRRLRYGR